MRGATLTACGSGMTSLLTNHAMQKFGRPFSELRAKRSTGSRAGPRRVRVRTRPPGIRMAGLAICPQTPSSLRSGWSLAGVVDLENRGEPFQPNFIIYVAPSFGIRTSMAGRSSFTIASACTRCSPGPYGAPKGVTGIAGSGRQGALGAVHASCVLVRTP